MFSAIHKVRILIAATLFVLAIGGTGFSQGPSNAVPYLKLTTPRHVLPDAQKWEGDEFPHTMSVLDLNRGGFRYWDGTG